MIDDRKSFFDVIERNLSSADFLLSEPKKLIETLKDLEIFLQKNWSTIFATLNDKPLSEREKKILKIFLLKIDNIDNKVGIRLNFFDDFKKYMKNSIEK